MIILAFIQTVSLPSTKECAASLTQRPENFSHWVGDESGPGDYFAGWFPGPARLKKLISIQPKDGQNEHGEGC
jgi:hypothetical protein